MHIVEVTCNFSPTHQQHFHRPTQNHGVLSFTTLSMKFAKTSSCEYPHLHMCFNYGSFLPQGCDVKTCRMVHFKRRQEAGSMFRLPGLSTGFTVLVLRLPI